MNQKVHRDRGDLQADFRIALISMPFNSIQYPSIQVGLLSAAAENSGFQTDTFHLSMELAALITPEIYSKICVQHEHTTAMLGEWLFSVAAFGNEIDNQDNKYFSDFSSELTDSKINPAVTMHSSPSYDMILCLGSLMTGEIELIGGNIRP